MGLFTLFTVLVLLGLAFGFWCFVGWVACLVAAGFGLTLPYWPVVGAGWLLSVVLHSLGGRGRE